MTQRTKCEPSHACRVSMSVLSERVNAAPTDAKLLFFPPAALPPAAPSGVQMLATIAIDDASSVSSTCGSRESLFFSRNSSAQ